MLIRCPLCGAELQKRAGKYGPFYGCTRFPECRGLLNVSQVERGKEVDVTAIRERHAESVHKERSRRANDNHRAEKNVSAWRAKMIAQDATTEPPFDDVRLPGEMYAAYGRIGGPLTELYGEDEPVMDDIDAEFAAMFR